MHRRLVATLLTLTACHAPAGAPDASIDATPSIDAVACSVTSTTARDFVGSPLPAEFQIQIPIDGPRAVFVIADELVVFGANGVVHVSLDGQAGPYVPLADLGTTTVELTQVVRGANGFGAIVHLHDGNTDPRSLCTLDAQGTMDLSRCTVLTESADGSLAFDGTAYQHYVAVDGRLERHTYDDLAALVATVDLSPGDFPTDSVVGAAITPSAAYVLSVDTVGGACGDRVREHVIGANGDHAVRELFATDVGAANLAAPVITADDAGGVSVLAFGACLVGGCATAPESGAMLTTYQDGVRTIDAASVDVPISIERNALLRDAGQIVVLGSRRICYEPPFSCDDWVEVTRLDPDATVDRARALATPATGSSGEALPIAATVIAPGDYAVSYTAVHRTWLRRFHYP